MDLVELGTGAAARHPWEEARAGFFLRVLGGARLPPGGTVLDVGAGDGFFARELRARFPALGGVACWDAAYSDEILGRSRFSPAGGLRFTRERPEGEFGLLLLLDVLEHVEDDAGFLASLVGDALAGGGHALVSVPAWPALHGPHDEHLRHHRRYAPASARRLLRGAGLEIVLSGGLFSSLLAVRALQVARERLTGRADPPRDAGHWSAPRAMTRAIRGALSCDARICLAAARLGIALPGLSFWALCRKPRR